MPWTWFTVRIIRMILAKLFLVFLRIGMFAVGGAYSFLPLIEREVVQRYHWLTKEEFLDVLGIAAVFPGAISIKFATYTGYKISGVWGAVVANIGNMCAPCLILIGASFFYIKHKNVPWVKNAFGMVELVIFAMIIAVAFQAISLDKLTQAKNLIIIVVSFILFLYTKIHPALIIISAGVLGIFLK